MIPDKMNSYFGKRILVTGHTGFKGSGAEVSGLALKPEANSLYQLLSQSGVVDETFIDIRNSMDVEKFLSSRSFDGVFHLAAQSLVRRSYREPLMTFETNVLGTGNILDSVLKHNSAPWVVAVTTDKVYKNTENESGYREDSPLGGTDPYSASKAACEMIIQAYQNLAKLKSMDQHFIAARSGNVIGGGDTAEDRLFPDILRSFKSNNQISIRSPKAIRPWQHVLDPLSGYLTIGEMLISGTEISPSFNFGPDLRSRLTVEEMVQTSCSLWPFPMGYRSEKSVENYLETEYLWLNSDRARNELAWTNKLDAVQSIEWTLAWEKSVSLSSARDALDHQVKQFFEISL
jgi:CDP-glucose 4,6-dehydratase